MPEPDPLPRRLAAALAVALLASVLSGLWLLRDDGHDSVDGPTQRFVVDQVVVERADAVVTLRGIASSSDDAAELTDALVGRADVVAVINQLEIDEAAPPPRIDAIHRGLDDRIGAEPAPPTSE